MKIKELFEQYDATLIKRRSNRKAINGLIKKNKEIKREHNAIRDKLINEIVLEMEKGKTLYQICRENFGVVDSHFHKLYLIIEDKMKKANVSG